MPYNPEDISTIDALIGYSCVNERGASEFKLPGYFRGVSSELLEPYSFITVRDERGRGLEGVKVEVENVFNDVEVVFTDSEGKAIVSLGQLRRIDLFKDKVGKRYEYVSDQTTFDLVIDMPKVFQWEGIGILSSGTFLDQDAQAFLNATKPFYLANYYDLIGKTEEQFDSDINNLFVSAKDYALWNDLGAFYPFVGGTADSHKFNAKDPRDLDEAFRITWFGGLSHGINGVQGNGVNGYGNTHFRILTHVGSVANTHMSFYSRTIDALAGDFRDMGSYQNPGIPYTINRLIIRFTGNNFYHGQGTGNVYGTPNIVTHGLFLATRDNNSNYLVTFAGTESLISAPFFANSDRNVYILAECQSNNSVVGFSNKEAAFASIGSAVNDRKDQFKTFVQDFQISMGRAV